MKKTLSIAIFSLFFISVSSAQADAAYSRTLKKMFEITGTQVAYKAAIVQMFVMFKQQYPKVKAEMWSDLEEEFSNASLDDLVVMLVPVYSKYMTQADLEEVIRFYQTPVGKKFSKSTPLIVQESMQIGQQWGMKIGEAFEKKMKEKGY